MRHKSKRGSWLDDCLLAAYTLALAAVYLALFGSVFSWQALLAILIVPILLLCCHERYRAATLAAAIALPAGALVIVPPRWSFRIDADGLLAILVFAFAAMLAIGLGLRESQRKPAAPPNAFNA